MFIPPELVFRQSSKCVGTYAKRYAKLSSNKSSNTMVLAFGTVAVWFQKKFFPLLTGPQGSQGCQKNTFFFSQMKLFSFCAKIAPKRHKLKKTHQN